MYSFREIAKKVVLSKKVIAIYAQSATEEFQDKSVEEIMDCIEGIMEDVPLGYENYEALVIARLKVPTTNEIIYIHLEIDPLASEDPTKAMNLAECAGKSIIENKANIPFLEDDGLIKNVYTIWTMIDYQNKYKNGQYYRHIFHDAPCELDKQNNEKDYRLTIALFYCSCVVKQQEIN